MSDNFCLCGTNIQIYKKTLNIIGVACRCRATSSIQGDYFPGNYFGRDRIQLAGPASCRGTISDGNSRSSHPDRTQLQHPQSSRGWFLAENAVFRSATGFNWWAQRPVEVRFQPKSAVLPTPTGRSCLPHSPVANRVTSQRREQTTTMAGREITVSKHSCWQEITVVFLA